jgi:DNA repair protein RecN (Recombination protein N)
MLIRLKVNNFLLIEQLELDFRAGITVVTGETGSGKSIIIDALMFIFGARASAEIIRTQQKQATFEAEFTLANQAALNWLVENDLNDIDDPHDIICRRVIDRSGRNKVYINGHAVTTSQVRALGDFILDIHTQHASITLLKPEMQRSLLDEYSGTTNKVQHLSVLYKKIREVEQKLHSALSKRDELEVQQQILHDRIRELTNLNLKAGEWEELEACHKQLINAGTVLQELEYIGNVLHNQDNSILDNLAKLHSRLVKLTDFGVNIEELNALLNSVEIELQELAHSLTLITRNIEQDPHSLEDVEARMNQIFDLSRKYRIAPAQILQSLAVWQQELAELDQNVNLEALEQELTDSKSEYKKIAAEVTRIRQTASAELAHKVTKLLHKLAISGEFNIHLRPLSEPANHGLENVEYQVCFNKGMILQPLTKAASGGELSRTALALYLLLSIHNPPEVIIFDEIDVGIGGKVAAIVGQMLYELGKVKQVICITHQPQTASYGNHHLVVTKSDLSNSTVTHIEYVEDLARVREIARMLGGMQITEATLNHAREMLLISTKTV